MSARAALVTTARTVRTCRASVAAVADAMPGVEITVLDLDDSYRPVGEETVLKAPEVGLELRALRRRALAVPVERLVDEAELALLAAIGGTSPVVVVRAGAILLRPPDELLTAASTFGLGLVARDVATPADGLWPSRADVAEAGGHARELVAVDPGHAAVAAVIGHGAPGGATWLAQLADRLPSAAVSSPRQLVSAWNLRRGHHVTDDGGLRVDGEPVVALDLSRLDPERPWVLRPASDKEPRARLSDHPVLADVVLGLAARMRTDDVGDGAPALDTSRTSLGHRVDDALRHLYTTPAATDAPDPFDPDEAPALRTWLTGAVAEHGATRYLLAVRASRPDLVAAFPRVPGRDTEALVAWSAAHAAAEGYPEDLLPRASRPRGAAAQPTQHERRSDLRPGVAVVGYLRGELGIGESARLMVTALKAAGIPQASVAVDTGLLSRQTVDTSAGEEAGSAFDTTLLCVNADHTAAVASAAPALMRGRHRIGMWYWEVEDFPKSQHGGFDHVDEVWVATDFIRDAIAPHSPVPVRTVTPPLPQRGAEPAFTRADLGLPAGPLVLFSFDFLSTAERKNPWGLVEAFRAAVAPGEGPTLVVKSINASRRSDDAERLRLLTRGRGDIVLMERHLDTAERDALTAHCDVYVSLHRSEGLGLTMAEAMAWGKPVIATGYSGNLQFMTEENSFLVPWSPTAIPADAPPYPAGGTWADPDLDAAATTLRLVLDHPEMAAERGARAAADIATLHSAEAAGRRAAEVLALPPRVRGTGGWAGALAGRASESLRRLKRH